LVKRKHWERGSKGEKKGVHRGGGGKKRNFKEKSLAAKKFEFEMRKGY